MNRITKIQLASLMLTGDLFALFCMTEGISVMTALGFSAGCIMQMFAALPLIKLYSQGRSLKDCGRTACAVLLAGVLLWGGALFSKLWAVCGEVCIPHENGGLTGKLLTAGLIAAVCIYMSSAGIKALARSGSAAMALGVLCAVIVIVSALMRSEPENLLLPRERTFAEEVLRGLSLSGGLSSFAVLLGYTKDDKMDCAVFYFTSKAVFSAAVLLTAVLVTGGIMSAVKAPVIAGAQLSQLFPVQRVDSLFMIVFSAFAVYSVSVQASAAEKLIAEALPKMTRYRCTSALAAMTAAGAFLGSGEAYTAVYAVFAGVSLLILPTAYALKNTVRRRAHEA